MRHAGVVLRTFAGAVALVAALAGPALAAPPDNDEAQDLNRQRVGHLDGRQSVRFAFHHDGAGDVTRVVVLPTRGAATAIRLRVFDPQQRPIDLLTQPFERTASTLVLAAAPGTYQVELENATDSTVDFVISAGASPVDATVDATEMTVGSPSP